MHGSAIYIREGQNYRLLDQKFVKNTSKTNEKLQIRLEEADVDFTLIYFSPGNEIEASHLVRHNTKCIVVGDFNLPNTNINPMSTKSDATGRVVEELLDEKYLLLNKDLKTHEKGSVLDLHLCSKQLAKYFAKFEIFEETLSNHHMTISEFNLRATKLRSLRPNWKCFGENKSQYAHLNSRAESIATHIKTCYENSLKEVKPIQNKEKVALNRKKHQLQRRVRKLRRLGLRGYSEEKYLTSELNRTSRKISETLVQERQNQELKTVASMNSNGKGTDFWKAYKKLTQSSKSNANQLKIITQEAADKFAEKLKQNMRMHEAVSQEAEEIEALVETCVNEKK